MKHKKKPAEVIEHKMGEGQSIWKITIGDDSIVHSFEFYISDDYSIEMIRQLIEDILIKDQITRIGLFR